MAQTFARFGSRVSLFEQTGHILPREDADAAEIVQTQMTEDGVVFVFDSQITTVESRGQEKVLHYNSHGEQHELVVDEILVGVGRAPNVEGLGLETAGVEYDTRTGVKVNNRLQTTTPNVYAAGDVCFPFKFTHTADAMAQIVIQNALFPHPLRVGLRQQRIRSLSPGLPIRLRKSHTSGCMKPRRRTRGSRSILLRLGSTKWIERY